jgi:hypothetical protein
VEADLTGSLDLVLGTMEPATSPRTTLPMATVAPPLPPGAPSPRTTLVMPPPEPAATPPVRTTLTMPTAAQPRDTIQIPTVIPPEAYPDAPPARDTVQMPTVVPPPVESPARDTVQMPTVIPAEVPAAPAAPGPRALTAAEAAALRARVEALLPLVREGDYFAVLGLPRDASAADVERAWREATRDLEPGVAEPALGPDLTASLAAVRRVLDEARRVLRDDTSRGEYRAHI